MSRRAGLYLGAALALLAVGLAAPGPFTGGPVSATPSTGVVPTGSISLAELAPLATDKILGRVSSGTGTVEAVTFTDLAQVLTSCTDVSCIRNATGQSWAINSATHQTSSTTASAIAGCAFTPVAGKAYRFTVETSHFAAVAGTGIVFEIQPGNLVSGSTHVEVQGTGVTNNVITRAALSSGVAVSLTGGTSSTSPSETLSRAMGVFTAHATAPTAFSVYAGSETAASQVDVTRCVLSWTQLN